MARKTKEPRITYTTDMYAYYAESPTDHDECLVSDIYDNVTLSIDGMNFEGEARHIRGWCEDHGFRLWADYVEVEVRPKCDYQPDDFPAEFKVELS